MIKWGPSENMTVGAVLSQPASDVSHHPHTAVQLLPVRRRCTDATRSSCGGKRIDLRGVLVATRNKRYGMFFSKRSECPYGGWQRGVVFDEERLRGASTSFPCRGGVQGQSLFFSCHKGHLRASCAFYSLTTLTK